MQQAPKPDFRPTLLACFPKHFSPEQEERALEDLSSLLRGRGIDCRCVASGAWFKQSFPQHGNWDSWVWETVHGRNYQTRSAHFHGFVAYGSDVGRATSQIAKTALQSGKVVFAAVEGVLYLATDVVVRDSNRWSDGWSLTLAQIGE